MVSAGKKYLLFILSVTYGLIKYANTYIMMSQMGVTTKSRSSTNYKVITEHEGNYLATDS